MIDRIGCKNSWQDYFVEMIGKICWYKWFIEIVGRTGGRHGWQNWNE